jgi:hypothetical protein
VEGEGKVGDVNEWENGGCESGGKCVSVGVSVSVSVKGYAAWGRRCDNVLM